MKRVAVVGSESKYWTPEQRTEVMKKIKEIFIDEAIREIQRAIDEIPSEEYKKRLFYNPYAHLRRIQLVSEGCPKGGVDIWAETVADVLGIEKDIKYPEVGQWDDLEEYKPEVDLSKAPLLESPMVHTRKKGYKSRNIEIAEICDVLYCIDPKGRKRSGARWTMAYAQKLGKETHLVLVE